MMDLFDSFALIEKRRQTIGPYRLENLVCRLVLPLKNHLEITFSGYIHVFAGTRPEVPVLRVSSTFRGAVSPCAGNASGGC